MTWHSATLVACRPQHTAWSLLMTSLTRSQAAQLARGMLACATRRHARPQHPPLTALSLTALPSPLSCAGACRPLGASAQGSRPAACPQSHHTQHWCRRRWRQRHAWILLCSLTLAAGSPGSGAGTLRARIHAQALLCSATVAARRPGSSLGTLRTCMHAQTLLCCSAGGREPLWQQAGYPASSHARADPAVHHHGRRKPLRQRPGYPASSHARAGSAVLQHGDCEAPRQRRGYSASSHASAAPAVLQPGDCGLPRQRHGYPASSHARADLDVQRHGCCELPQQQHGLGL